MEVGSKKRTLEDKNVSGQASLVEALDLGGPGIVGDVVAGGLWVQLGILGELEHVGSHHSGVLVIEDVAMVDESWVLSQLVERHVEVSIVSFVVYFCPNHLQAGKSSNCSCCLQIGCVPFYWFGPHFMVSIKEEILKYMMA